MNPLFANLPNISDFTSGFRAAIPNIVPGTSLEDTVQSKYFQVGLWEVVASGLECSTKDGKTSYFIPVEDAEGRTGRVFVNPYDKKTGAVQKYEIQRLLKAFGFDVPQAVIVLTDQENKKNEKSTSIMEYLNVFCRGNVGLEVKWTAPHAISPESGSWILVSKDGDPTPFLGLGGEPEGFSSYKEVERFAKDVKLVKYYESFPKMGLVPSSNKPEPAEELLPYYTALMELYGAVVKGEAPPPPQAVAAPKKPAWVK